MQAHAEGDAFEPVDLADWTKLMAFYGEDSSLSDTHPARRYMLAKFYQEENQMTLPCLVVQCLLNRFKRNRK